MMAEFRLLETGTVQEEIVSIESLIAMCVVGGAVDVVRAALGDQLNLCAGGAAAGIGIVAGGSGPKFGQCFLGNAQHAGKGVAILRIVDVDAVEGHVGLVAARAIDAAAAAVLIGYAAVAARI